MLPPVEVMPLRQFLIHCSKNKLETSDHQCSEEVNLLNGFTLRMWNFVSSSWFERLWISDRKFVNHTTEMILWSMILTQTSLKELFLLLFSPTLPLREIPINGVLPLICCNRIMGAQTTLINAVVPCNSVKNVMLHMVISKEICVQWQTLTVSATCC